MTKQIRDYVLEARQIRESKEQKNETQIIKIEPVTPIDQSLFGRSKFKLGEYTISMYDDESRYRNGISFFSNPGNRSWTLKDAKEWAMKWQKEEPGKYKIIIEESAQKNEANEDYAKRFNIVRDKLIAKIKNMSQASTAGDIQKLSSAVTICLNNLFLARNEFSKGYSEDLDSYFDLALKAIQ